LIAAVRGSFVPQRGAARRLSPIGARSLRYLEGGGLFALWLIASIGGLAVGLIAVMSRSIRMMQGAFRNVSPAIELKP